MQIFENPEHRLQIALAALALFHVGLDEIARCARARGALLALGELGGDEFALRLAHDRLVETRAELLEQRRLLVQQARVEQRCADGDVGQRLTQALVDVARRMADLQLEVPHDVKHRLDDALAPRGLLVGQQEQQIDVRSRRQRAAPVAADGDDGDALARRAVLDRIDMRDDVVVDRHRQHVLQGAEPLRAGKAAMILLQPGPRLRPPLRQRRREQRHRRLAEGRVFGVVGAQDGDTARQVVAVGESGAGRWPRARRLVGNVVGRHGRKMAAGAGAVHREIAASR